MKNERSKEEYEKAVKESFCIAEVCRKLNIKPIGGNYKTVSNAIKKYNIDSSHFTGRAWNQGKRYRMIKKAKSLEEILCKNTYYPSYSLKKRLLSEKYKEYRCENPECGLSEWHGKPIPLELHHINGDTTDNRLENLQLLCPNCHSQTDNFRGRNWNKNYKNNDISIKYEFVTEEQRLYRNKKRQKGDKTIKEKKYCKQCGNEIKGGGIKFCSDRCYREYIHRNIPSKEQLIEYSKTTHSIREMKIKYNFNVSDNAVIKWCKNYGIYDEVKRNFIGKTYSIEQYDLDNNLIREWENGNEIYKTLHLPKAGIQKCCRGEIKSCHGYIWKYKV